MNSGSNFDFFHLVNMAEIIENTHITGEQHSQFIPKERFNIPKSTNQKVKSTITSLNSGLVSSDNFAASAGTPYTFVLNPNNQTVVDLSQCYFNIAGTLAVPAEYVGGINTRDIKLGNLFVSSLFQQATLSIGGSVIALNANPGIDANMQAALKFDAYDLENMSLSTRQFMLNSVEPNFAVRIAPLKNGFAAGDFVFNGTSTTTAAGVSATDKYHPELAGLTFVYHGTAMNLVTTHLTGVTDFTITFDDEGRGSFAVLVAEHINGTALTNAASLEIGAATLYNIFGRDDKFNNQFNEVIDPYNSLGNTVIPFRCKLYLSDLFNYTVDSLDYIFNREISITLQRTSTNFIIANICGGNSNYDTKIDVKGITKFELITFSYVLTDDAKRELMHFYSKPVQTLYGVQTTNLTPLYNFNPDSEQNITLPLTVTYDTKAILLAFPKCSNSWTPLSTGKNMTICDLDTNLGTTTVNKAFQPSWYGSNSNSYNYGGLKYIRISNTSNSNIYTYDFNATSMQYINPLPFLKSFDYSASDKADPVKILDYREPYEQLKQLRLLFGKDPDNALSYYDYLKDYVIIPIDLTGSNIPPNTRIFVTFQFASFGANYNPLYYGNLSRNKQLSTNLLAIFLGSDVLEYRPDGTCIVKHVLQAQPKETTVNMH